MDVFKLDKIIEKELLELTFRFAQELAEKYEKKRSIYNGNLHFQIINQDNCSIE